MQRNLRRFGDRVSVHVGDVTAQTRIPTGPPLLRGCIRQSLSLPA